jgi:hypothetical protein
MITKFSFIPLSTWENDTAGAKAVFPKAVTYGNSKVVQYASPVESETMLNMVAVSGMELMQTNDADLIYSKIRTDFNEIYNCSHECALSIAGKFNEGLEHGN